MKTYYKAELYFMTELFIDNDRNQGCDPETLNDCGLVETLKEPTLDKLISTLKQRYDYIEHFEGNGYETGYEETERDGTHVNVMVSIFISEVTEQIKELTEINFSDKAV